MTSYLCNDIQSMYSQESDSFSADYHLSQRSALFDSPRTLSSSDQPTIIDGWIGTSVDRSLHTRQRAHSIDLLDDFPSPKALLFNTLVEPESTQSNKFLIKIYSKNLTFSTVLNKEYNITVGEIKRELLERYPVQFLDQSYSKTKVSSKSNSIDDEWILSLIDESNGVEIDLFDYDKIIMIQNKLFRSMWVNDYDLPEAVFKYEYSFKFILQRT